MLYTVAVQDMAL